MRIIVLLLISILTFNLSLTAGKIPPPAASSAFWNDVKVGGVYYLSYQQGEKPGTGDFSEFLVKRAYLTVQKTFLPMLSSRVTLDAYQDVTGDLKARMKYLYAAFNLPNFYKITDLNLEFGLVHTPWLDFEEHINYYRMQDTMFMERVGIIDSGDFGLTIMGYIGGRMAEEYRRMVNDKYCGRYGSFAAGIYNGGGYHAQELNENKVFQGRLTVRPLPDLMPGLQMSYFQINGKVNQNETAHSPASPWAGHTFMLSYEHKCFTLTGQYITGYGNKSGQWINWSSFSISAWNYEGYSFFAELKAGAHIRGIARYDHLHPGVQDLPGNYNRYITGAGWDFGNRNLLLIDYDWVEYHYLQFGDSCRIQTTLQLNF